MVVSAHRLASHHANGAVKVVSASRLDRTCCVSRSLPPSEAGGSLSLPSSQQSGPLPSAGPMGTPSHHSFGHQVLSSLHGHAEFYHPFLVMTYDSDKTGIIGCL